MTTLRACVLCSNFAPAEDGFGGQCRRYAPMTDDAPSVGHWPRVREMDYCGEFSAIPAPPKPSLFRRTMRRLAP